MASEGLHICRQAEMSRLRGFKQGLPRYSSVGAATYVEVPMHTDEERAGEQLAVRLSFQASKCLSCQKTGFMSCLGTLGQTSKRQLWHKLSRQQDVIQQSLPSIFCPAQKQAQ